MVVEEKGKEPTLVAQSSQQKQPNNSSDNKAKGKAGGKDDVEELSEEDLQLKSELELYVTRLEESNAGLYKAALEGLRNRIRSSTTSMTSVPKPLKFLNPHYARLVAVHSKMSLGEISKNLADILSVLSMTYASENEFNVLKYRILGSQEAVDAWGHEYVRHLAMELGKEYGKRSGDDQPVDDLKKIALEMIPFFLSHNAEPDACDLLMEIESLNQLPQFVDSNTWSRVCLYLLSCVSYVPYPEDLEILKTVRQIYLKFEKISEALSISIRLNNLDFIKADFSSCKDPILKKQLGFLLARQQINFEIGDEEIQNILNNSLLSENFLQLGKELEILEPKTPEDIYKSHLENVQINTNVDSARHNLASTFVNAFVNAGFGKDKLMLTEQESNSWIFKNKTHGMLSAAASLGSIMLWDVEGGLAQIDKYLYSNDDNVKAGALLAIGLVNVGTNNESDPALALLSEYVNSASLTLRVGAIYGLGLAYAGSSRSDLLDLLMPIISDVGLDMQLVGAAALSLGFIFVGSCHGDLTSLFLQTLMERDESALKSTYTRFIGLALGLLFLGKQEAVDATLETLKVIPEPASKQLSVLAQTCAYAGTGNVLKVQEMLHLCSVHVDKEKDDDTYQMFAVIGIALIAMGEEIGSQMAVRQFNHLMHYGEASIRKAVPLALALISASNPQVNLLDTLGKYSHDSDVEVAQSAIFAMGIVGAGTNNARLAQMLRQLASYYHKELNCLFVVRIAQGLIHMGKGSVTLNPYHFNRLLMSPVAVSGLLGTLLAFTDAKNLILSESHYMLYFLMLAMYPRFLITLDENLKALSVSARVGQAVDTVGQAGKPKTITGFQTHNTPVLMAHTDRAELATEEYIPLSHVLEGFVIVKKNPEWINDVEMK